MNNEYIKDEDLFYVVSGYTTDSSITFNINNNFADKFRGKLVYCAVENLQLHINNASITLGDNIRVQMSSAQPYSQDSLLGDVALNNPSQTIFSFMANDNGTNNGEHNDFQNYCLDRAVLTTMNSNFTITLLRNNTLYANADIDRFYIRLRFFVKK